MLAKLKSVLKEEVIRMGIVNTKQWLEKFKQLPNKTFEHQCDLICEPLLKHFPNASKEEIHQHLLEHGLFLPSVSAATINELVSKNPWKVISKEYALLQKEWQGPDIPIFIFPSNERNQVLKKVFNGKTGLSFKDKIFLFVSSANSENEWRALITHEYHHTCRLSRSENRSTDLNLLETMVLEGLAEQAVKQRLGKSYLAPWTTIYNQEKAKSLWNQFLKNKQNTLATHPTFHQLLYGTKMLPKYLGYNVGYHIVSSFCEHHPYSSEELLKIAAKDILKGSHF